MTKVAVPSFLGMAPRFSRRHIQDNQAQVASNARLTSGAIQPLRDTYLKATPGITGLRSIFRIYDGTNEYFLGWDVDADACQGAVPSNTNYRTFFTGDNEPRVTDKTLAIAGSPYPFSFYVLGVFPPQTAPGVSHAGGASAAINRSFCYTFVNQWGEESAPSPASSSTVGKVSDGTWTISNMDSAPPNSFATTGGSWAGGVATLNVAATPGAFGLRVGEEISVSGVTPSGYNTSSAVITAVGAATISYAVTADPGAYSGAGTISRIAPHNTSGMFKRLYWSNTISSGTFFYLIQDNIAIGSAGTTVAGSATPGEELPTTGWSMPPVGLRGLKLHPSGSLVGFLNNDIYMSVPSAPYAWPATYVQSVDYGVVGLGIYGSTIVIGTGGMPYQITGVDPESMAPPERINQPWPCLAKNSMVDLGFGVAWAAPQGLALIGIQGSTMVTASLYTQEEWRSLNPSTFRSACYAGRYVASYDAAGDGNRQLLIIDPSEAASVATSNKNCQAVYSDNRSGSMWVVVADKVYEWDSTSAAKLTFDWMSKEFLLPNLMNMSVARVQADFSSSAADIAAAAAARAATIAANAALIAAGNYDAAIAQPAIGELDIAAISLDEPIAASTDQLQFQLYYDNVLQYTKTVTSSETFRLPDTIAGIGVAVRISGNVTRVLRVDVADSAKAIAEQ